MKNLLEITDERAYPNSNASPESAVMIRRYVFDNDVMVSFNYLPDSSEAFMRGCEVLALIQLGNLLAEEYQYQDAKSLVAVGAP